MLKKFKEYFIKKYKLISIEESQKLVKIEHNRYLKISEQLQKSNQLLIIYINLLGDLNLKGTSRDEKIFSSKLKEVSKGISFLFIANGKELPELNEKDLKMFLDILNSISIVLKVNRFDDYYYFKVKEMMEYLIPKYTNNRSYKMLEIRD